MKSITSIFDLETMAQKRRLAFIFDYVHGGSEQQITVQRNLFDMGSLFLRQHDMRNVSDRDMSVTMVGDPARISLAIGPTGLAGLMWPRGECEEAKAAADFGVPYRLSTMSISTIVAMGRGTVRP